MTARKLISFFCLLSLAITAGSVPGSPKIYFTGQADDGEWNNAANWEGGVVPGNEDRASIPSGVIKITNTVTTGYLQNGIDTGGVAQVIIDGGSLVAVGTVRFNSASYIGRGSIIIQNGGSAVFNSRFMVGFENTQGGSVTIYDGTLRVTKTYHHNETYAGTEILDTRTTINPGGLLDVNDLVLNAGILDIAGGTLIIRRCAVYEVDLWFAEGRIISMGGKPGWKIKVTFDEVSGWTAVVAEPVMKPLTVGGLNPVPSLVACLRTYTHRQAAPPPMGNRPGNNVSNGWKVFYPRGISEGFRGEIHKSGFSDQKSDGLNGAVVSRIPAFNDFNERSV